MKEIKVAEIAKAVKGTIISGNPDTIISSVRTNSKDISEGALFVPIIGERVDGHDFIEGAYKNGALACFSSRDDINVDGLVCIKVGDTLQALQDFATYYRNQFTLPIIGITGSVGKTTTKEIVSSALSTRYKVIKTAGNMNSQVGLPLMMFHIEDKHEIAVIEMGISEEGEMDKLVSIAQPDVAIVTNIGVSHIGILKTKENIRKEKLNIINEFHNESCLFVNGNDPMLMELSEYSRSIKDNKSPQKYGKIDLSDIAVSRLEQAQVKTFGISSKCDYFAENIKVVDGSTYFTLINVNNESKEDIILNVLGDHNINNALCALAISEHYNIPNKIAKRGLEEYRPIAMRGEIKKSGGLTIVDDTYNASPDSMKSGIDILLSLTGVERRIAVLADVLELGDVSHQCHYDVGKYLIDKDIDELITIGKEAVHIAKAVEDGSSTIITHSFYNNSEANKYLKGIVKDGDSFLVKGSRGMKTEEIVDFLLSINGRDA